MSIFEILESIILICASVILVLLAFASLILYIMVELRAKELKNNKTDD